MNAFRHHICNWSVKITISYKTHSRVHACSFQLPYALSVCSLVKTIKDKINFFFQGSNFRLSHYAKSLLQLVMTKTRLFSFVTTLYLWHVVTDCGKWKLQALGCQMILFSYQVFWKSAKFFQEFRWDTHRQRRHDGLKT